MTSLATTSDSAMPVGSVVWPFCSDELCWQPIGKPAPDGKGFVYEDEACASVFVSS